jgi:hypothetical protein
LKIAFDENVPAQMVRVFQSLGQEKRFKNEGLEIVSAADHTPKKGDADYRRRNDVPWLTRFAKAGGKVVVSGNTKMMSVPHEMQALRQLGFIVFFFEGKWSQWTFFPKSALLLFYWPAIAAKVKTAKPGQFWRIPNHFRPSGRLRNVTPGKKQIQKTSPRVARGKVPASRQRGGGKLDGGAILRTGQKGRKGRPPVAPDARQGTLELPGGGPRDPKKGIE